MASNLSTRRPSVSEEGGARDIIDHFRSRLLKAQERLVDWQHEQSFQRICYELVQKYATCKISTGTLLQIIKEVNMTVENEKMKYFIGAIWTYATQV